MSTTKKTYSNQVIADDFITYATEIQMDNSKITKAAESINKTTTAHAANGSVASMIFYLRFNVAVKETGGKTFTGDGGGISTPGGGALIGDVYTDNLTKLYSDTVSFQFNCTPVYTSLLFFDKNSNLLGHYQSGSVSTVLGTGGGSGKWA